MTNPIDRTNSPDPLRNVQADRLSWLWLLIGFLLLPFTSLNAFFQMVAAAAMRIPVRPVAKAALQSWVAPGFTANQEFAEQFIVGLMNWNWEAQASGYSGVMPSAFSDEELHRVHLPVLLLIGDQDKLNPPTVIERARQAIPHIEAHIIPKAGHLLSMEQPERVDAHVLKFLAEK